MDILLVVLAFLSLLIGLAGCIVPILPGPPLSYLGLLLIHWTSYAQFSKEFLLTWAVITIVVTALDYFLPIWMTQKFGGSRAATIGATIGLIAGFFVFPPIGIILCPFLGAFFGELVHDSRSHSKAFKVALGSFMAFIFGTGIKMVASAVMIFYAVKGLIA